MTKLFIPVYFHLRPPLALSYNTCLNVIYKKQQPSLILIARISLRQHLVRCKSNHLFHSCTWTSQFPQNVMTNTAIRARLENQTSTILHICAKSLTNFYIPSLYRSSGNVCTLLKTSNANETWNFKLHHFDSWVQN